MSPSRRLLVTLAALLPLAIAASVLSIALLLLLLTLVVIALLSAREWWQLKRRVNITAYRQMDHNLSHNRWCTVELQLRNDGAKPVSLEVHDMHPAQCDVTGLPAVLSLNPQQSGTVRYRLCPTERGDLHFEGLHCRTRTLSGLWRYTIKLQHTSTVRVYPDFADQRHSGLLGGLTSHASGAHIQQQRGEGSDFNQLRQFRLGDTLRTVDWKATSRQQKLIAREYQQERDQQIVLLLDSSRRMRHADGQSNHLDESLNAILVLAHVALQQGDSVSMLSSNDQTRWMPPVKGAQATRTLLNHVYDLQATHAAADYRNAATQLMTRVNRRALIIWITNTRNEESQELTAAISLLRKRHLVVLADLRETITDTIATQPSDTLDNALTWIGMEQYRAQRRQMHEKLRACGAITVDTAPALLTSSLVGQYQQIKQSGAL